MKFLIIPPEITPGTSYLFGVIIAVILLAYLVYAISKPEKF